MEVRDADIVGLDLRHAVAQSSRWTQCTFRDVRLSAANFGDATFDGCKFIKCRLDRTILVSRIYRTRFESCDFDEAIFRGADIQECDFVRGRAHLTDWGRATIQRSRIDLDFRDALLNFAVTNAVDFSGSSLWSAASPWNCAFFVGNTFDSRQVGLALALMSYANIPEPMKSQVRAIPSERHHEMVRRLVLAEREPEDHNRLDTQ